MFLKEQQLFKVQNTDRTIFILKKNGQKRSEVCKNSIFQFDQRLHFKVKKAEITEDAVRSRAPNTQGQSGWLRGY